MTRRLTNGEVAVARIIFGEAIDYARVLVHRGKFIFFQPDNTAMTPNGQIYFPDPVYKPDFSLNVDDRAWLIHELVHVWQHQRGVNLILAAPFSRRYDYGRITGSTDFARLNIEQQASVVADYYYLTQGRRTLHGSGTLADYRRIIPFLPGR